MYRCEIGVLSADTKGARFGVSDSNICSLNAAKLKASTKWADARSVVTLFDSLKTYRVQRINERMFVKYHN